MDSMGELLFEQQSVGCALLLYLLYSHSSVMWSESLSVGVDVPQIDGISAFQVQVNHDVELKTGLTTIEEQKMVRQAWWCEKSRLKHWILLLEQATVRNCRIAVATMLDPSLNHLPLQCGCH